MTSKRSHKQKLSNSSARKRARKGARLGQHFLTGLWAAEKLAQAIDAQKGETILEIGPGKGALTRELLKTGAPVVAIEKDEALVKELKETFKKEIASGHLRLVSDDIRNVDAHSLQLSRYVLAANIPYYITGEIIRQFLETDIPPRALALLIQKEVADRIIARDGKESILSISVKAYGRPSVVAKVTRGNFSPPPSVDSAILRIENVSKQFFNDFSERHFFELVRLGFSSKRKLLLSNVAKQYPRSNVEAAFQHVGLAVNARAEDLEIENWKHLALRLSAQE